MNDREMVTCQICGESYQELEPHECNLASTKVRLVRDLMNSEAPLEIIEKARAGYYDSYETTIATPITQLARDARDAGLLNIMRRAMDGDYDGTREEGDAYMEREGKKLLEET